jgi:hypothetical protein
VELPHKRVSGTLKDAGFSPTSGGVAGNHKMKDPFHFMLRKGGGHGGVKFAFVLWQNWT